MPLSTFLTGRTVTQLRGAQFLSFSASGTIQRRTATYDIGGGAAWAWATIATVPCRVYPVTTRGRAALIGGALDERSSHYCAMPVGTDVTSSDRILIDGDTYEVTMVPDRTDALTRLVEVMQT